MNTPWCGYCTWVKYNNRCAACGKAASWMGVIDEMYFNGRDPHLLYNDKCLTCHPDYHLNCPIFLYELRQIAAEAEDDQEHST